MSDSLDDFFAKKDKKRKNKSQSAALSAEALVRELEEGAKQADYNSRRDNKTSAAMELLGLNANDNDWKDFEEVEKRDYTGLKVKEMSIQDQDDEQRRLTEQSEQVPETIPWKSKEDTVAAIISTKIEQLAPEMVESEEVAADSAETTAKTSTTTGAAEATTTASTDEKSPTTDHTDSDASKAMQSSTQTDDTKPTDAKQEPKEDEKTTVAATLAATAATATSSSADADKKDGDSKPATSAKKYVPPHERLDTGVKMLEPTKLSKLRTTSSRFGNTKINIENTQEFPSLG